MKFQVAGHVAGAQATAGRGPLATAAMPEKDAFRGFARSFNDTVKADFPSIVSGLARHAGRHRAAKLAGVPGDTDTARPKPCAGGATHSAAQVGGPSHAQLERTRSEVRARLSGARLALPAGGGDAVQSGSLLSLIAMIGRDSVSAQQEMIRGYGNLLQGETAMINAQRLEQTRKLQEQFRAQAEQQRKAHKAGLAGLVCSWVKDAFNAVVGAAEAVGGFASGNPLMMAGGAALFAGAMAGVTADILKTVEFVEADLGNNVNLDDVISRLDKVDDVLCLVGMVLSVGGVAMDMVAAKSVVQEIGSKAASEAAAEGATSLGSFSDAGAASIQAAAEGQLAQVASQEKRWVTALSDIVKKDLGRIAESALGKVADPARFEAELEKEIVSRLSSRLLGRLVNLNTPTVVARAVAGFAQGAAATETGVFSALMANDEADVEKAHAGVDYYSSLVDTTGREIKDTITRLNDANDTVSMLIGSLLQAVQNTYVRLEF